MDSIPQQILTRGLEEILHFSTNLGLTGCLHTEFVLPRNKLRDEEQLSHILTLNAPFRLEEEKWFDKTENWIDYVNLSISEITTNLLKHSLKWHVGKDIYWLIMSFRADLMENSGIYFATTNNIYQYVSREGGPTGLAALFAPSVRRKPGWTAHRGGRPANLTTCEQAEILYPGGLPMKYLWKVYVREGEEADRVSAVLAQFGRSDVEVVVDARKFAGRP